MLLPPPVFIDSQVSLNSPFTAPPKRNTIAATRPAIPATSRPYSTADAPSSPRAPRRIRHTVIVSFAVGEPAVRGGREPQLQLVAVLEEPCLTRSQVPWKAFLITPPKMNTMATISAAMPATRRP